MKALQFGKEGEELAIQYLIRAGYTILDKNWRYRPAELDIICRDGSILVIVEVKTRSNILYGYPEEFVSKKQQKQIIRATNAYAEKKNWQGEIRFDIISVTHEPFLKIKHLKEAFYP